MSKWLAGLAWRIEELRDARPSEALVDELIELGEALHFADRERGLEVARRATAIASEMGYRSGEAWALLAQCHCLVFVGPYGASIELAGRALDYFEETNDDRGRARALTALSEAHNVAGDVLSALEFSSLAVALADRSKDGVARGWAFNALGYDYHVLGDLERAVFAHERALSTFESAGLDVGIAYARGNLGWDLLVMGQPERALELFILTHEFEREHLPGTVGVGLTMIGRAELALGRHQDAVDHLGAAIAAVRASKEPRYEVTALIGLSQGLAALHDSAAALTAAEEAVTVARAIEAVHLEADALGAYGKALLAVDQTEAALCILREATSIAERAGGPARQIDAWTTLALALEDHGQYREAFAALMRSTKLRPARAGRSATVANQPVASPRALSILQRYREDSSILTLCSYCHSVAVSDHTWGRLEAFLQTQLDVRCSHGICPTCFEQLQAELDAGNA